MVTHDRKRKEDRAFIQQSDAFPLLVGGQDHIVRLVDPAQE